MKKNILTIQKILSGESSEHEVFHEKTEMVPSKIGKITPKKVYFKAYDRFSAIQLGKHPLPPAFKKILMGRSSRRDISPTKQIDAKKLGSLLHYSAGIKKYVNSFESYRFYPSAGGRFPVEIYVIPKRVEGMISGGVYHYNVRGDHLEERLPTARNSFEGCFQQPFVHESEAIIVVTGVFKRTTMKYGQRGYRYVLLEAGHLGQNLYLVGESLRLQICGICGFYDKKISEYLHIDGVSEAPLYCFTLNS